ncbi:MAG TPA: acyl-CoA desaturase [Saprospiraceae bacterium]|nr:acyl-CoA desaturase [Saprospiraceae bacterium]
MTTVKFKTGEDIRFFQTLRSRVDAYFQERKLSKNANSVMVFKTVVLMSAYVLPFVALLIFPLPFVLALSLWLLMGWAQAGVGMSIMHDANHGAYSQNELTNKIIGFTVNMIGGTTANWKVQHNMLHHTFTNITGIDEDIETKVVLRFSPHAPHYYMNKGQWWYAFFFYGISTMYWASVKDFKQYLSYRKRGLHKGAPAQKNWLFARLVGVKLAYFFTFFGVPLLVGMPFWQALVGFTVMHFACGVILSIVFQLAHTVEETLFPLPDETGSMEDSWAVHQFRTTMNFATKNKWLSWYIGGLNFQVEHHLFTRICHVHYPAIAPIVKQTAQEFGVPYLEKRTFGSAFSSHIRLLKRLGRTPMDEIMG